VQINGRGQRLGQSFELDDRDPIVRFGPNAS
jgi:hypothetical protein